MLVVLPLTAAFYKICVAGLLALGVLLQYIGRDINNNNNIIIYREVWAAK